MKIQIASIIYLVVTIGSCAQKSILFTRHGARSPKVYTEIDKNYYWNIKPEDLTQIGLQQHKQLGESKAGNQIMDKNGNCIYENLEIQASTDQRVVMSTIGFLKGLCPNNYVEIIKRFFIEYYAQYSTNIEAWNQIMQSDFANPYELDLHYFVKANDFLFHGHQQSVCPAIKNIKQQIQSSDYYKSKEKSFKSRVEFDEVFSIIQRAYPSKTLDKKSITLNEIQDIFDDYSCNTVQGFIFPNPSESAIKYMEEVVIFIRYYEDNSELLENYAQLSEPFKWLISQLYSTSPFSWYSGHESNQFAILSVISDIQPIIPFASQLDFIVKNELVMVYFNKIQIQTKFCQDGYYCTREQTVNFLTQYIHPDLNTLCNLK
ncbi:unnamed protein product [Paramecium sonneborni]|uniref:Histidine phosphatase family (Branch 2) protein n=1 Tax=Paramecium sonneborni TaxID=65129 RepID=A0A8S1Q083_9CILI|nr:unnamed protein product [Paramecium sonneborni]